MRHIMMGMENVKEHIWTRKSSRKIKLILFQSMADSINKIP